MASQQLTVLVADAPEPHSVEVDAVNQFSSMVRD